MKGGHISVAVPMLNESESVDALSRCGGSVIRRLFFVVADFRA